MSEYFIGLMSGTSCDGVDAALVEFTPAPRLHADYFLPYAPALRTQLMAFADGQYTGDAIDQLGRLDTQLGGIFAATALALIKRAGIPVQQICAIGSHGQTVRHRPDGKLPFTLQIADPSIIVAQTGITTVADFRRRDLALGGQGAPLVPAFHRAVFANREEARVVMNIGGIANLTLLPAADGPVSGWDTGPGNLLMDMWSREYLGKPHDENGAFAASGTANEALLQALVADEYFQRPAPKSTGREHFSQAWLAGKLAGRKLAAADVMATLSELTAHSIAEATKHQTADITRVLVCGGGVHNAHLIGRLAAHLPGCTVVSTGEFGIPPDWVEAMAFAWLARETLAGRPGNLPTVTGARQPTVLGGIYPA